MSQHRMPDPKGRPREVAVGLVLLTVLAGVVVTRGGLPSTSQAQDPPQEQAAPADPDERVEIHRSSVKSGERE